MKDVQKAIKGLPLAQRTPSPRGGEGRGEGGPAFQNILPNLRHIARLANHGPVITKQTLRLLKRFQPQRQYGAEPGGVGGVVAIIVAGLGMQQDDSPSRLSISQGRNDSSTVAGNAI